MLYIASITKGSVIPMPQGTEGASARRSTGQGWQLLHCSRQSSSPAVSSELASPTADPGPLHSLSLQVLDDAQQTRPSLWKTGRCKLYSEPSPAQQTVLTTCKLSTSAGMHLLGICCVPSRMMRLLQDAQRFLGTGTMPCSRRPLWLGWGLRDSVMVAGVLEGKDNRCEVPGGGADACVASTQTWVPAA